MYLYSIQGHYTVMETARAVTPVLILGWFDSSMPHQIFNYEANYRTRTINIIGIRI